MRAVARWLFILGIAAFVASAVVAGGVLGDILWRAGVAAMLVDLTLVQLWPAARPVARPGAEPG